MAPSKSYGFLIFLLPLGLPVSASPVTLYFTGHVVTEAINGCGVLVNCGIVTGSYTFDSATPDQNADPKTGLYAGTNFQFQIDGVPFFSAANGFINVANYAAVDQYGLLGTGTASNSSQATLSVLLSDPTAAAFNSDALPQNPAALVPLLPGTFQLNAADNTFQLMGSIDGIVALAPGNGLLQVCKVAGAGLTIGTPFNFIVGGAPVTVQAGPGPGGSCSPLLAEPAGNISVTETIPAGVAVTAITSAPPGTLVNSIVAAGVANVTVQAGAVTIVTYTDAVVSNTGSVQVCKTAGPGVSLGTPFAFNVGGTPVTVGAGTCSTPILEPAGTVGIAETLPSGFAVTSIGAVPGGALVSSDLNAGTASVKVVLGATATVTFTNALVGTPVSAPIPDTFQVRYAAHLDMGDSYVNLTNAGTLSGLDPGGRICVNVYTFDPAEEMISCCACPVTPNGLNTLSVRNDLISNTLTPGVPTAVIIKLLATTPLAGVCNAGTPAFNPSTLVRGMRAWGTTLHALPGSPPKYGSTETPFSPAELSMSEASKLSTYCQFIQANGSGFGICKSCRAGAQGAVTQ